MRCLFLSILVLFATQPLQASFCDMGTDQSNSHQTISDGEMHAGPDHAKMDHSDPSHDNMGHGSMDHGSNSQKMDCCGDDSASSGHGCTAMAHCGACPAGLVAIHPVIASSWMGTSSDNVPALSQVPPNQFSSPPFRPPIY